MTPRDCLAVAATLAAAMSVTQQASADPTCTTVDGFNAAMASSGGATTTITLKFDVTGVNPADFPGTKGCLVDFEQTSCTVGNGVAGATLKVYGADDPPNLTHPAGSLKFEYANECCAAPPCQEGWADPNASAVIFSNGTEQCTVTAWLDPAQYGYTLDCGGTVYQAVGDNVDALGVDRVAMFKLWDGGWEMPSAVSTYNEVCYEPPAVAPAQPQTMQIPVLEDATASPAVPDAVATPVQDLSLGSDDGQIFLKFDLGAVPGKVTKAQIFMHQSDVTSAEGDGGDAFAVPDVGWSEATLTYSGRPATTGASLARQSPISAFTWYAWDVGAAVGKPAIYSFALVPGPSDTNGAHFFSKEGSATLGPYMLVEYAVVDADGDGSPDGPDCDDGAASVHPGAAEVCNGVDDDCNGIVDDGCAGGQSGATTGGGDPNGSHDVAFEEDAADTSGGCGCRAAGARSGAQGGALIALALAAIAHARGRRRRLAAERFQPGGGHRSSSSRPAV